MMGPDRNLFSSISEFSVEQSLMVELIHFMKTTKTVLGACLASANVVVFAAVVVRDGSRAGYSFAA
jgi:hypothetical protein